MNKLLLIPFFCIALSHASAEKYFPQDNLLQPVNITDTNITDTIVEENLVKEDKLITEVIQSGAVPKKESIQYINQVAKFGFKNLFSNYSYNTTLPYNAQINPNAELFVQDYIKIHGNYL